MNVFGQTRVHWNSAQWPLHYTEGRKQNFAAFYTFSSDVDNPGSRCPQNCTDKLGLHENSRCQSTLYVRPQMKFNQNFFSQLFCALCDILYNRPAHNAVTFCTTDVHTTLWHSVQQTCTQRCDILYNRPAHNADECVICVKIAAGRAVLCLWGKRNNIYTCAMKLYDILTEKKPWSKSVYNVAEYQVSSILQYVTLVKVSDVVSCWHWYTAHTYTPHTHIRTHTPHTHTYTHTHYTHTLHTNTQEVSANYPHSLYRYQSRDFTFSSSSQNIASPYWTNSTGNLEWRPQQTLSFIQTKYIIQNEDLIRNQTNALLNTGRHAHEHNTCDHLRNKAQSVHTKS